MSHHSDPIIREWPMNIQTTKYHWHIFSLNSSETRVHHLFSLSTLNEFNWYAFPNESISMRPESDLKKSPACAMYMKRFASKFRVRIWIIGELLIQ